MKNKVRKDNSYNNKTLWLNEEQHQNNLKELVK